MLMRMKIRFLSYSLLIHLGLVAVFFFFNFKTVLVSHSETVDFDFVSVAFVPSQSSGGGSRGHRRGRDVRSVSLKELLPTPSWTYQETRVQTLPPSSGFTDASQYLHETHNLFAASDNTQFHQALYSRIDSFVLFDSLLAQYSHFGVVFVEFQVEPTGVLLGTSLRTSAEDPILKVHALRALRKALSNPLLAELRSHELKPLTFKAKFEFLSGSREINFEKQKAFNHQTFVFSRATSEKPQSTDLSEHLLNGGVGLDPFAVADAWEKYNKHEYRQNTQVDPFESYRRDSDYNL